VVCSIARRIGQAAKNLGDVEQRLLVRSLLEESDLGVYSRSARFGGFTDTVTTLSPSSSRLWSIRSCSITSSAGYTALLDRADRLDRTDRQLERWLVVERMESEIGAWPSDRPLYVHGFEDLTGASGACSMRLRLVAEVTVALPYEPGRAAFAAITRTQEELARRAQGRISELQPRSSEYLHPGVAFIERNLFDPGDAKHRRAAALCGFRARGPGRCLS